MMQLTEKVICQCFNKMMLLCTSLLMYNTISTITFLTGRLEERWYHSMSCAFTRLNGSRFLFMETPSNNIYKSPTMDTNELKMRVNMKITSISKGTLNNVFFKYCKRDESMYFSRWWSFRTLLL